MNRLAIVRALSCILILTSMSADSAWAKVFVESKTSTTSVGQPKTSVVNESKEPVLPTGISVIEKQGEYLLVGGASGQGVCTSTGRLIIPTNFGQIRYVGDNLFAASNYREDGSCAWWLLDSEGRTVSKLPDWTRVDSRRSFSDGLLNIGEDFSPTAFVNRRGNVVPNFDQYTDVKEFSFGLAAASYNDRNGRRSGFVNRDGKMVIGPFRNAELQKFENGVAVVSVYSGFGKPKAGLVSTTGKFVVPMSYEGISPIGNGKFWAHRNNRVVILDSTGKVFIKFPDDCTAVVAPDKFSKNSWIACGFGGTVNKSLRWGYCDVNGKVVLSPRPEFQLCQSFVGNLAVVYKKGPGENLVCGIINRKGDWVVQPRYSGATITDDSHWTLGPEVPLDGKFASAGPSRALVFEELLKDHDFIGMPLSELEKVLGKLELTPDVEKSVVGLKVSQFGISHGCCGSVALQFAFDAADKVAGWRIRENGYSTNSQPWITENVVLGEKRKGLQLGNLVPKK